MKRGEVASADGAWTWESGPSLLSGFMAWQQAHTSLVAAYEATGTTLGNGIAYALSRPSGYWRPRWCLLMAHLLGDNRQAVGAALALEMVHTYSLIHDDLPCMDDADLRRHHPTLHVLYDEAFATLVGDALLADAFRVLTRHAYNLSWEQRGALVTVLSEAAGSEGMVLGQVYDTLSPAKLHAEEPSSLSVTRTHALKTGALFTAALMMGAQSVLPVSEASGWSQTLQRCGRLLGRAYQIYDDLEDHESCRGKPSGQDKRLMRPSMIVEYGYEHTEQLLAQLIGEIRGLLYDINPAEESHCEQLLQSCFQRARDHKSRSTAGPPTEQSVGGHSDV